MSNSQINIDFITTENIEMLWEIILDDIKNSLKSQEQVSHARGFFINQARVFFEREKTIKQNLMQMNKKFIGEIMTSFNSVKQQQPTQSQQQLQHQFQPQKINISNKEPTNFTIEDLHSERLSAFEKSLAEKKNDFMSSMSVPVPEAPKFSDAELDKPIGSAMDELIARTLAQRNFEIENIHKSVNKNEVEKWLKPAETSVKSEKMQENENSKIKMDQKQMQYQYVHQQTPKLINIGPPLDKSEKTVTWGPNSEYEASSTDFNGINLDIQEIDTNNKKPMQNDIFSKLKAVKEPQTMQTYVTSELKNMNDRINSLDEKINTILSIISKIKID
jgi:hypothetical protein